MSIFIRTFACMKKNISHTNPVTTIKALLHVVSLLSAPLLLTAAILMAACSSDDATDAPTPTNDNDSQEINVNTSVAGMITRATIYEGGILTSGTFTCAAYNAGTTTTYITPTTVNWNGEAWAFSDGKHYWPESDFLDFVAYYPDVTSYASVPIYNGAVPSFTATLPMTVAEQDGITELILAFTPGQSKSSNSGQVTLTFLHPFALIKFVIAEGSGTVKINSISIADLYTSGTCTCNGTTMTWGSYSGSSAMSQTGLNLKYGTSSTETTPFIVIPNNYGLKALTVNATWDDWSNVTKDISTDISINWQPGYTYTYTLTVTKYALTVDTEKFTEQW